MSVDLLIQPRNLRPVLLDLEFELRAGLPEAIKLVAELLVLLLELGHDGTLLLELLLEVLLAPLVLGGQLLQLLLAGVQAGLELLGLAVPLGQLVLEGGQFALLLGEGLLLLVDALSQGLVVREQPR
jgi:hypothetical protein